MRTNILRFQSIIFASSNNSIRQLAMTGSHEQRILNLNNINPNVKTMEYAVRGPLVIRAVNIEKELASVSNNANMDI